MKTLEDGKKRIQHICDAIRLDALEPAKLEAEQLRTEGERQKQELIAEGKKEKERLIQEGRTLIDRERTVFQESLAQAAQQAIEAFKQQLEADLFNEELENLLQIPFSDPQCIADIVSGLVCAIDKEGLAANLQAQIAKSVEPHAVNKLLAQRILQRLQKQAVEIGEFAGGAKIEVQGRNMKVSLTMNDVKKLLADHLRKDFRKLIFAI